MTGGARELRRETADIEASSEGYAARFAGPVGEWMLRAQEEITIGLLADLPRASVLDVGGGHAQLAGPLVRSGRTVTVLGSDASCAHRLADLLAGDRCRFVAGDVLALPFPDRSFDVAISFRLLSHCERWPRLVGELCRVARRAVIVDYPTSASLNRFAPKLFGMKQRLEGNTRTFSLFTHADVARAFAAAGYDAAGRKAEFFLPMVLHRALRCRPCSAALEAACRAPGLTRRWGSPVIARFDRAAAPA